MPCHTTVAVTVKNKDIAHDVLKSMGVDSPVIIKGFNGEYNVRLSGTGISESKFKTEYGMKIAEQSIRTKYGYKARVFRNETIKDGKGFKY